MSIEQGKSALAGFGIKTWPQGTPEEVVAAGLDPKAVASCCAPPGSVDTDGRSFRGCPVWDACRFYLRSMGGFKGKSGARYIGYRQIHPSDGTASEDIATCYQWTYSMQAPADAGAAERRVTGGKRGSVMRVIAQEGGEITTRFDLAVNAKGEVVNAPAEVIPILKDNNVPYSTLVSEPSIRRQFFELKRTVPHHPRVGETQGGTYAQRVALRDLDNELRDREFVDAGASDVAAVTAEPEVEAEAEKKPKARNPWGRAGKPKEADG